MRFRAAALAALMLVGSISGQVGAATAANSSPAGAQPSNSVDGSTRQIAIGVANLPSDGAAMDAFTASVGGHAPALWAIWSYWGGSNPDFPAFVAGQAAQRGA